MKLKLCLISMLVSMLVACGGSMPSVTLPSDSPATGSEATAVPLAEATAEPVAEATAEPIAEPTSAEVAAPTEPVAEQPASTVNFVTADMPTMDGAYYQLQTKLGEANNLCLEGQGGAAPGSGAVLDGAAFLNGCLNVTGQTWKVSPLGNGYYRIQNLIGEANNLCLEGNRLAAESLLGGASVMTDCQDVSGQHWRFVEADDEYYYLQPMFLEAEHKCLDSQLGLASGPDAVLGGSGFMNDCQPIDSQLWKIKPISTGPSIAVVAENPAAEPTAEAAAEATVAPVEPTVAQTAQFSVECAPEYVAEILKFKDEVIAEIALERDEATQKDGIPRPALIWNDQLACQSQEWAQAIATDTYKSNPHCCYGPIPIHSDTGSWKQPAAEGISMGKTATEAVRLWRDTEMENFDFSASEAAKRKDHTCIRHVCGHYGAIIGLFTTEVGCGYYVDTNERNKNNYNFVCQYIFKQAP